jgi:hypothetical protein
MTTQSYTTRRALLIVTMLAGMVLTTQCHTAKPAAATQAAEPVVKPAPATPIDAKKAELGGATWSPDWDVIVEKAIPSEMLSSQVPRDVQRFCPRFYVMSETDKRAFWAYFFQALAGAEAGLNPTTCNPSSTPPCSPNPEAEPNGAAAPGPATWALACIIHEMYIAQRFLSCCRLLNAARASQEADLNA